MTTGVTFTAIGVRPLTAGVKTATEGSGLRPLWPFVTAASVLPWHNSKIKQGIPATHNVPESLVFSGFPNILFLSFVSNKRFTFRYTGGTVPSPGACLSGHHNTAPGSPMLKAVPHALLKPWHISQLSLSASASAPFRPCPAGLPHFSLKQGPASFGFPTLQ